MNTTKHFINKVIAGIVLMLVFLPYPKLLAQQLDCDPLPEDIEQLMQCNMQDNGSGTYNEAPGTNPAQPAEFNFSGIGGIAASYSSESDQVLVVGTNIEAGDRRPLYGVMAHPQTLVPDGARFRIDAGGAARAPMIAYNEETNRFLVIWLDWSACNSCIYGRFVTSDGTIDGAPFLISAASIISGIEYDPNNDRYLIGYQNNGIYFRTVGNDRVVGAPHNVVSSFPYEGQMGVTVNTNTNEYWFVYATVYNAATADTPQEDDRIFYSRFNAQTLQVIGSPVQLSATRLGRLAVQKGMVAYSTAGGGAMAIWLERDREGIAGMWGRTIYDDGTLSTEYPVLTVGTFTSSSGYEAGQISYNPWTDSFFVFSGDWDGYGITTEIDLSGIIYENQISLSPGPGRTTLFEKVKNLVVTKAYAQASGTFFVTGAVTPHGSVTLGSRNYATTVGTSSASANAQGAPPTSRGPVAQQPQDPQDIRNLPILINQLYVWGLGISVLLALLMSIMGGYYYMTSAGNAEQASKGKEYITSALIGLVIIFTAYLVLNQINPDLVNFNVDSLNLR